MYVVVALILLYHCPSFSKQHSSYLPLALFTFSALSPLSPIFFLVLDLPRLNSRFQKTFTPGLLTKYQLKSELLTAYLMLPEIELTTLPEITKSIFRHYQDNRLLNEAHPVQSHAGNPHPAQQHCTGLESALWYQYTQLFSRSH